MQVALQTRVQSSSGLVMPGNRACARAARRSRLPVRRPTDPTDPDLSRGNCPNAQVQLKPISTGRWGQPVRRHGRLERGHTTGHSACGLDTAVHIEVRCGCYHLVTHRICRRVVMPTELRKTKCAWSSARRIGQHQAGFEPACVDKCATKNCA